MENVVRESIPPKKVKSRSAHPKSSILWVHDIVEFSLFGAALPAADFPYRKLPKQVLLDTPTLDLLVRFPNRLSHNALRLINECEEGACVSLATAGEWAEWMQQGHYGLEGSLTVFFEQIVQHWQLQLLPVPLEAYTFYTELPVITAEMKLPEKAEFPEQKARKMAHNDRYDQLIAAHATVAKLPLVSPHQIFKQYERFGLKWVW